MNRFLSRLGIAVCFLMPAACGISDAADNVSGLSNLTVVGSTSVLFGAQALAQTVTVVNDCTGCSAADWTATKDAAWITVSPASGTLGEADSQTIRLEIDRTSIPVGQFTATVTLDAGGKSIELVAKGEMLQEIAGNHEDDDFDGVTDEDVGTLDPRCYEGPVCVPDAGDPTKDLCGRCKPDERCNHVTSVCVAVAACAGVPCGNDCCTGGTVCEKLEARCVDDTTPVDACDPPCASGQTCKEGMCHLGATTCGWFAPGGDASAEMCVGPGGDYDIGCDDGTDDCDPASRPRVHVSLSADLYVDRFEVTNRRYEGFLAANASVPIPTCDAAADLWRADRTVDDWLADHPVVCVSAAQAQAFCAWARKVLPTEAEWEAAARGHDDDAYPWGEAFDTDNAQCLQQDPYDAESHCSNLYEAPWVDDLCPGPSGPFCAETAPVVAPDGEPTKREGKSASNLYHMAGNAAEWTADGWKPDHGNCADLGCLDPLTDPAESTHRVVRGGSWKTGSSGITVWAREKVAKGERRRDLGFRCAVRRAP